MYIFIQREQSGRFFSAWYTGTRRQERGMVEGVLKAKEESLMYEI